MKTPLRNDPGFVPGSFFWHAMNIFSWGASFLLLDCPRFSIRTTQDSYHIFAM